MSETIDASKIAYCQIYPGLGIARLGNSPDEFFIGPETPGVPASPVGGFKDGSGRIKRQAARFRVYAYAADNTVLGELTAANASIEWSVHLTNRKAEYMTFRGRFWQSQYPNFYKYNPDETPLRNQEVLDPEERAKVLVIDPGPRAIKAGDAPVELDGGTFGPLPYSDIAVPPTGKDPLSGSRNGWWNCAETSQMPEPVRMSGTVEVPLGTLRVDADGRLLVLGGYGNTDTLIPNNDIGRLMTNDYYANNDYWHDDTSDGPVTATVTVGGHDVPVKDKAWVLVVPPKFVPFAECLTTLYETATETWEKAHHGGLPDRPVSFTQHIYPILRRLGAYTWLNLNASQHHGPNTNNYFADVHSPLFGLLSSNAGGDAARERMHIFGRLRPPGLVPQTPDAKDTEESAKFANYGFMPQMSGDGGEPTTAKDPLPPGAPGDQVYDCKTEKNWPLTQPTTQPGGNYITWLTLSERQYSDMKLWAEGKFAADWIGVPQPVPFEKLPVAEQPEALSRAALEPCVGAPFYPGIEITYIATAPDTWSGPCRVKQSFRPGDITSHMALPWQSDFSECATNWWPTARPDDVVSQESFEALLREHTAADEGMLGRVLASRVPWARGIPDSSPGRDNAMVKAWSHFGFVVPKEAGPGQIAYVETERSPYFGFSERDFFYFLMNIDSYPDFAPRARQLAHEYLAQGRQNMTQLDSDEVWGFFEYSPSALGNRLELIYANFVRDNQTTANPRLLAQGGGVFAAQNYLATSTREREIYKQLQMAPFNQLDGAWLRRAIPDGPVDDVGELLAQIRQDELGDGETAQNHANVYTDMLKSLNIYLPDLHTRTYAQDPRLLDEAFTQPCFLLAISQFDDDFLPEILGMTLYLEWSSIGLITTINTLESFGIDPIYYKLHVGIDNAASGHGARARQAVEMYLDQIRASQGEGPMREAWARIWTGYVTFGTLGTLGNAINAQFEFNSYDCRVQALIAAKAPFASQSHGTKFLGGAAINDWFQDPAGFMNELQTAGLIVPGRADVSPFFQLLGFNGPMFHVFTADEEQLLRDWCNSLGRAKPHHMSLHDAMCYIIDSLRQRQTGETGHKVRISGPDPKGGGGIVTLSLHEWFALPNNQAGNENAGNEAVMAALACPDNGWIVPHDSIASPLTSSLLAGNGDMAVAFRSVLPDGSGRTFGNVLAQWIDAGCPVRELLRAMAVAPEAKRTPLVHRLYRRQDGKIWGMGTPH